MLLLVWPQPSQAEGMSEDQIKSGYVFNFVKFAEWPAGGGADDKVELCLVGRDVLGGALSALDGRKVGGRELHVVQYSSDSFLERHSNSHREQEFKELDDATSHSAEQPKAHGESGSCQVVFIGVSEQRRFVSIIKALGDSPALTISDIENFAEKGGCIGLSYREDKIVFEVNLASTQKSGFRLPAQLLNLASYVFGR